MKTIITFGSGQLTNFNVKPLDVMLVVEADSEKFARQQVFDSVIGTNFCTSYSYEKYVQEFTEQYGMQEYSLEELMSLQL